MSPTAIPRSASWRRASADAVLQGGDQLAWLSRTALSQRPSIESLASPHPFGADASPSHYPRGRGEPGTPALGGGRGGDVRNPRPPPPPPLGRSRPPPPPPGGVARAGNAGDRARAGAECPKPKTRRRATVGPFQTSHPCDFRDLPDSAPGRLSRPSGLRTTATFETFQARSAATFASLPRLNPSSRAGSSAPHRTSAPPRSGRNPARRRSHSAAHSPHAPRSSRPTAAPSPAIRAPARSDC